MCGALLQLHAAGEDPREIVRRALQLNERNDEIARSYTFLERQENDFLDGAGSVKHRDSKTWDVTLLEGSPYRRLIRRNDMPLPAKEEKEQQENLEKSNAVRRQETPEQRQERIAAWEHGRKARQDELKDVPNAFDFRLIGEEEIDGVKTWVIEGRPRAGYRGHSKQSAYYLKMKGRIWVSKDDYQPVKIEAESIDTIALGAFLVRLGKGAHVHLEFARVNGEVWLPKEIRFGGAARIVLVKGLRLETDISFSDYKKFTTESHVVGAGQ